MNRRSAIESMLAGKTVRAVDPLYFNPRRSPWFRWSDSTQCFEWCQLPHAHEWKRAKSSLYLASEFEIVEPATDDL